MGWLINFCRSLRIITIGGLRGNNSSSFVSFGMYMNVVLLCNVYLHVQLGLPNLQKVSAKGLIKGKSIFHFNAALACLCSSLKIIILYFKLFIFCLSF